MPNYDAIVIGAGHNALVTAAYVAKAGKKVLVLERRPIVGGIAVSEEIFPGFKVPSCAHLAGSFSKQIIADLNLKAHGFELLPLDPLLFAPAIDGISLLLPRDFTKAAVEIARHSKADAEKFQPFCALAKHLSGFLQTLYAAALPTKANRGAVNPVELLRTAWNFHRLGERDMYAFLRVLPMSLADWLNEWFQSDSLKAALAASGILGSFVGPRQQGTSFNFLHQQLGESNGALRTAGFVRGGIGNLSQALARAVQEAGGEIRTGAEVVQIIVKNGAAKGVVLKNGHEINADKIVSGTDVKQTFLKLLEPACLEPHFLLKVRNIRARGSAAKINLALERLPEFKGEKSGNALGGVIYIAPTLDYLERAADDAKYGRFSAQPFLEITVPSIADPSLSPEGKHVMSVWMQSAPYGLRGAGWPQQRAPLADTVISLIEEYAPGFKNSIVHRHVLTPLDLEAEYGLTGGHLHHAEMALDQIFFMRPLPGWARYHTPIENLFLCGSGTHPGGGITGLPGRYAAKEILKHRVRQN